MTFQIPSPSPMFPDIGVLYEDINIVHTVLEMACHKGQRVVHQTI